MRDMIGDVREKETREERIGGNGMEDTVGHEYIKVEALTEI